MRKIPVINYNMKLVVVVIPVHSSTPSEYELASFVQCFRILHNHPIKVLAPVNLNLEKYKEIVPVFDVIFIEPHWQSGIENYNTLKIDPFFYDLFKGYKFLLTYELDAWVFKDELAYWCGKNYDYIGAPWFEGWHSGETLKMTGVGNSGFSLRNVQTSLRILRRLTLLNKLRNFWFVTKIQALLPFQKFVMLRTYFKVLNYPELNNLLLFKQYNNEDFYWGDIIRKIFADYKVSPLRHAIEFSFEANPQYLFEMNNQQLPFGCHAWNRYNPEFWKQFIHF